MLRQDRRDLLRWCSGRIHNCNVARQRLLMLNSYVQHMFTRAPGAMPIVSIVVPFFWFNQIYNQDPISLGKPKKELQWRLRVASGVLNCRLHVCSVREQHAQVVHPHTHTHTRTNRDACALRLETLKEFYKKAKRTQRGSIRYYCCAECCVPS